VVGIRAGVDFRQFGVNTHWQSTDQGVAAAGAADRYIAAFAGLELVFDGVGGRGGGEEEAAPAKKPAKAKKAPAGQGEEEPEVSADKPKAAPEEE
jgi:hypothetical protein